MRKRRIRARYERCGFGKCTLTYMDTHTYTDVIIPKRSILKGRVVRISERTFERDRVLERVAIPRGVEAIELCAFRECENLLWVGLPRTLKRIGQAAFKDCEKLRNILMPPMVTGIEASTFLGCSSIESIDLSSVHTIGEYAFHQCSSLTDIKVGNDLKSVDATAFLETGYSKDKKNWEDGLLYLGKWVIGCDGSREEYTVRADTVGIAANAFFDGQHVKRTENPKYTFLKEQLDMASYDPRIPIPNMQRVPKYFDEITPAKIRYNGTAKDWSRVIVLQGEVKIPAFVSTSDKMIETIV